MELSPGLYSWFVRPRWFTKIYVNDILKSHFDFQNKKVIDFGCGTGSSSIFFNPKLYLGVDVDHKRVSYARTLHPQYRFLSYQGVNLPVDPGSVDYIIIVAVLHHVPPEELTSYLAEFKRVLRPEGKILVIEPCFLNQANFNNRFMAFFDRGKFIREVEKYQDFFTTHGYAVKIIKTFKKLLFYNEVFFLAYSKE